MTNLDGVALPKDFSSWHKVFQDEYLQFLKEQGTVTNHPEVSTGISNDYEQNVTDNYTYVIRNSWRTPWAKVLLGVILLSLSVCFLIHISSSNTQSLKEMSENAQKMALLEKRLLKLTTAVDGVVDSVTSSSIKSVSRAAPITSEPAAIRASTVITISPTIIRADIKESSSALQKVSTGLKLVLADKGLIDNKWYKVYTPTGEVGFVLKTAVEL